MADAARGKTPEYIMNNYFIAPVSSDEPFYNYKKTVLKGVDKSFFSLNKEINNELNRLKSAKAYLWGLSLTKNNAWRKIRKGSLILFYRNKHIISYSSVEFLSQDKDVAERLWGISDKKHYNPYTWPLLIFLSKPHELNIPIKVINAMSKYKPNYCCRTFFQLNDAFVLSIKDYKDFNDFVEKESV
ncbi:MAG: hypothetical protein ACTHNG_13445 [Ginsengibacter sp.]